jgi:metal-responsive CopG/Arc/MetJ family transcriptional regulator
MRKCIRTTISIPKHLKERMDQENGVNNWSEIASTAFERKLDGEETEPNFKKFLTHQLMELVGIMRGLNMDQTIQEVCK